MIDLLIIHAGELLTCRTDSNGAAGAELQQLEIILDGAVAIEGNRIIEAGATSALQQYFGDARKILDAHGRLVSPGLVDCHSHLVHAGSRHEEYERLITGRSNSVGRLDSGIRYTVNKTREAGDAFLRDQALADLDVMLAHGTTTLEAKSGYGLDYDTELRLLQIQHSLQHEIDVVSTYLGAHVLPDEYRDRRNDYIDLVIHTLPEAKPYAEYCDVCCDPIGFTPDECARICDAAKALGFRLKFHADQTGYSGGSELAAKYQAKSADHLDYISAEGIRSMALSGTIGVLLPSVTFHMMEMVPKIEKGRLVPAPKAFLPLAVQRMIEGGMWLAISADYNPGTSPSQSMQMAMQTAARLYRLGSPEIWHMSTINAAWALDRASDRGSIEVGKRADLVIWKVNHHGMVINRFGVNLVDTVIKNGKAVIENQKVIQV
ncbi:MAG: imidazolonepropionase [Deltaproteobacteria bacterium RBG_16_54_11]|nr:MAG: imidazolonepropionase [Deltaproteobacteria bacterium RBG_16_54_11]